MWGAKWVGVGKVGEVGDVGGRVEAAARLRVKPLRSVVIVDGGPCALHRRRLEVVVVVVRIRDAVERCAAGAGAHRQSVAVAIVPVGGDAGPDEGAAVVGVARLPCSSELLRRTG